MFKQSVVTALIVSGTIAFAWLPALSDAAAPSGPTKMSPEAKKTKYDPKVFRPDPSYDDKPYSPQKQIDIYGAKKPVEVVNPLLELFRPVYKEGPFEYGGTALGEKNLIFPGLSVFGDWRTAVAYNDNGAAEKGQVATRLNLDIDYKITGTERIHAFIRPLDKGGNFTRHEFSGGDEDGTDITLDGNLDTLFFEGDVGQIYAGLSDTQAKFDLPIALGLMPYLTQNGVWIEDAFVGGAATLAAKSSPKFDITNMDVTLFGGFDKVTTPAFVNAGGGLNDDSASLIGLAAFIEANEGYYEFGYGFVNGEDEFSDLDYHSLTGAFTKRYAGWLSNSLRAIWTFGQSPDAGTKRTADGIMLLAENSLITSLPSTLVPYFNAWVGIDQPQPLADDTGILKNTGINFETDGLTGFPKLDDSGHDSFGGALGVSYIFNLDRQIVLELARVQTFGDDGNGAVNNQTGLGIRYQHPISPAWIIRTDAMVGLINNSDDLFGSRLEIRRKF
ncbi:MAG: hypothetical protein CFH10_00036 [Alphaproteobacteria bacterium MarineAlpha4_Bin2]|nr:MAG: hypothetical protein CFH10_00036 [Alphaproteobacteria bacterium MarineAlpha4_Bin2]